MLDGLHLIRNLILLGIDTHADFNIYLLAINHDRRLFRLEENTPGYPGIYKRRPTELIFSLRSVPF
jgi:hypothetical protein